MTTPKILIVEDEQPLRMSLARVLKSGGYDIAVAGDAVGAVSTAVRERPDLILLDLGLPAGSGTVVLARLRNLPGTSLTPVIVVTGGQVDYDGTETLRELGCETVLRKPVAPDQLLDAVGDALGEEPLQPGAGRQVREGGGMHRFSAERASGSLDG
jgi:CheY-like chemotaxis protein